MYKTKYNRGNKKNRSTKKTTNKSERRQMWRPLCWIKIKHVVSPLTSCIHQFGSGHKVACSGLFVFGSCWSLMTGEKAVVDGGGQRHTPGQLLFHVERGQAGGRLSVPALLHQLLDHHHQLQREKTVFWVKNLILYELHYTTLPEDVFEKKFWKIKKKISFQKSVIIPGKKKLTIW